MIIKVCVTDICRDQLNDECLAIIAKFADELRDHNGSVLHMEDRDLVHQVFHHTKTSSCRKLEARYNQLKRAIKQQIKQMSFYNDRTFLKKYAHNTNFGNTTTALLYNIGHLDGLTAKTTLDRVNMN